MDKTHEIVFIFLGEKLPRYAVSSLKLASATSGMNVLIIGNRSIKDSVSRLPVRFIAIEDFYDSKDFIAAASHIWADHKFRSGFWLKSLERLFVLHQYMGFYDVGKVLHAELDQLVFQIQDLVSHLDSQNYSGIFVPFHNELAAVASVLYVNDIKALASLLDYSVGDLFYPNEMYLIAQWAQQHRDMIFELPTVASYLHSRRDSVVPGVKLLTIDEAGGLVDAAQIGQWVAGIDPKNVPVGTSPLNKFVDKSQKFLLSKEELESLEFLLSDSVLLYVSTADLNINLRVFNLHIHSKIHSSLIDGKLSLEDLIQIANSVDAVRMPGARSQQVRGWVESRLSKLVGDPRGFFSTVTSRFYKFFGLRLSSKPFISGDSFRAIADLVWESGSTFSKFEVSSGSIIFCESELLEDLNTEVLSQIHFPVVLILGNSDRNIDRGLIDGIHLVDGSAIFAQNLVVEIPSVTPLPIGLENRWRAKNGTVLPFLIQRRIKRTRRTEVLWGFSVSTNPEVRSKAALALLKTKRARLLGAVNPARHRLELSGSKFVASPPGNGIDTHRTWEAMYLGCIPILLDGYLSRYLESINLPVWVVNSYDELIDLSEADLNQKYQEIIRNSNLQGLDFKFWESRINSKSLRCR